MRMNSLGLSADCARRFNVDATGSLSPQHSVLSTDMHLSDIKESALMAIDTLRVNKLRSSLTVLGVTVGVVTVIFMVSIIQGLNKAFADQIEALGSNAIWATKFDPSFGHQPTSEELHRKDLTLADADAIRNEAPSVLSVSPIHR